MRVDVGGGSIVIVGVGSDRDIAIRRVRAMVSMSVVVSVSVEVFAVVTEVSNVSMVGTQGFLCLSVDTMMSVVDFVIT